jgi:hypothetical protein
MYGILRYGEPACRRLDGQAGPRQLLVRYAVGKTAVTTTRPSVDAPQMDGQEQSRDEMTGAEGPTLRERFGRRVTAVAVAMVVPTIWMFAHPGSAHENQGLGRIGWRCTSPCRSRETAHGRRPWVAVEPRESQELSGTHLFPCPAEQDAPEAVRPGNDRLPVSLEPPPQRSSGGTSSSLPGPRPPGRLRRVNASTSSVTRQER